MADLAGYISGVEMFYDTSGVVGCMVVGKDTTIQGATLAVAFGLDGATNVMTDSNTLKVFGNEIVTGTLTVGGETIAGGAAGLSAQLDALGT